MTKTSKTGARIPSRGIWFVATLTLLLGSTAVCGEAAAQSWIWWAAAGQNTEYSGAMTNSTAYAGGADADAAADSLMPALVYADSTSDALNGGASDSASYWVTLPSGAMWYLWGRFYYPGAPGSNDANSFLVSVDGGARKVFGNNKNYYQKWHWGGNGANEWGGLTALPLGWLNSGGHRITIEKREVSPIPPRLDAVLLTSASTYVPVDTQAAPALGVIIETPGPRLSAKPATLTFPSTAVGATSAAQVVTLSNTGKVVLNITAVTIGGTNAGDFTKTASAAYSIQPGASTTFNVAFAPKAAGTRTATLSIASNGGNATISLTGAATTTSAPKLSVTPTSLTFPSTAVGATSTAQTVKLSNTGNAVLSVTSVTLGGTNAADFTKTASATYSIQPGANATFNVAFAPKAAGARTATLSIASNGGNAAVSLTGTATPSTTSTDIYLSAALAPTLRLVGAMTTSTAYTAGNDLDPALDSLCSKLVYANSTVNSWYNMTTDEAAYTFHLPVAGAWYLWCRFYYPGRPGTNDANSFIATLDNGVWYKIGNKLDQFQRFHWDGTGGKETGAPAALKLGTFSAGTHMLRIRKREVTPIPPRIDAIFLTMDPTKPPTDAAARIALGIDPPPGQSPAISVTPTTGAFGKVAVGSSSTAHTVTITNTGTAVLSVSGVAITGAQATSFTTNASQTYTIQPAAKATFTVTFAPKAAGVASAALEISSNAPTAKVSVPLTGEGTTPTTGPVLQLDTTSINFGTIVSGATSPANTVNATNVGGSELSISSISITGAQAAHFAYTAPTVPIKLAAGGKTAIQVTYKPTAVGASAASLVIASNDAAGNKTVALSGVCQAPPTGTYPNDGSVLGTNLTGLADYSSEWPFSDCYKMSRGMWSATQWSWNDPRPLDVDANGWPKSLQDGQWAKSIIFWDLANKYPSGNYVVLYDGEGTLAYEYAATLVSSSPGRDVISVDSSQGGFGVSIATTNAANYVRNVRVIMPGLESTYQTEMFNPTFIASVKNYKVLRFMDWMNTNGSGQINWADRPKPTDAQWTIKGAPLEVICALANKIHADPWVCVPHRATDDYVLQMATLMKAQLNPGIRAWVEYSNEVWNWGFPQASYASQMGLSLGLTTDQYAAVFMFHSRRTVECANIFAGVFADETRLVRVMGAQSAGSWWAGEMLKYNNAYQHVDALAIAPYFGGYMGGSGDYGRIISQGVEGTINELQTTALPEAYGWIDACAAVAAQYNVALVAYEGGQHMVGVGAPMEDAALNAVFDAVNRDPRIGQFYTAYLNYWKSKGGDIFVHFNNAMTFTKYGRWGSMEYLGQPRTQAPKYDALQNFIEANRVK
ncbi:MAG: choice-of-anchor D domain-containing protein [Candidatus Hydrogenedentes bacterium]|nr:choice-of-anchor D domain-containing protein [Candidatus Hydrogenedentota bacterium]